MSFARGRRILVRVITENVFPRFKQEFDASQSYNAGLRVGDWKELVEVPVTCSRSFLILQGEISIAEASKKFMETMLKVGINSSLSKV